MTHYIIKKIFQRITKGQKYHLKIVFANGSTYENTRAGEPDITIIFRKASAEWRLLCLGPLEFMEAYFDGDVDIIGDHALFKLVQIGYRTSLGNFEHPVMFLKRRLLERKQNNKDLAQAKKNATFHYGLPMEFFRLILGDTYGYSEGLWEEETKTLSEAKHNLYDRICRELLLQPGDKLVEVGAAWGYMSMLAAEKYGAEVTNYGVVKKQNEGMQLLVDKRELGSKVSIVEKDHRDLINEPGKYDKYVSIGVYEHAGRDCAEEWIKSIAVGLREDGIGLISATFNTKKQPTNYCTIKHVFPGGFIPSLSETLLLMEKYDLEVKKVENMSYHYDRTMREWLKNLEENWTAIQAIDPAIFTEKFRRIWLLYLGGVVEIFEAEKETLNLYHITFVKGRYETWVYPKVLEFSYK